MKSTVDYVPLALAASELGISEETLRRDRALLRKKLGKSEFDNSRYEPGLDGKSFAALRRFRELAALMGRKKAIETLRINGVD